MSLSAGELLISFLWGSGLSSLFGPIGWLAGFFTPAFNTIVGLGIITLFKGKVSTDGITTNVIIKWKKMRGRAACLGSVVLGDEDLHGMHLPHEQGHFVQSLLLGPLYWFVIAIPSFTRATLITAGVLKLPAGMNYHDYYHSFYTEKWADSWMLK
ncbi:MAG: hypothetical protein FWG29_01160 [Treponema sp.]|nr:hypothetical protein [Treponema sp.]